MRQYLVIHAILSSLLLSCNQLHAADAPDKIKPVMILSGSDSAVTKPARERCCSQKEFLAVWKKLQDADLKHHCPQVDFESYMVIAVFDGAYAEGSYMQVCEVVEEAESIRIRFESRSKQTIGGIQIGEPERVARNTRSYTFIVLPASKKAIVIEVDTRSLLDKPHEWKEDKNFSIIDKK